MDENSVDFVKKFQDLAKEMAGENNKTPASSSSSGPMFPALSNTEANSRSSDDSNSGSLNFKHILRQTNMNGSWLCLPLRLCFCPSTCFSSVWECRPFLWVNIPDEISSVLYQSSSMFYMYMYILACELIFGHF